MAKTTCQKCDRNVLLVRVGGELIMTDPELIRVVPAKEVLDGGYGGDKIPRIRMAQSDTYARRLHAELCDSYREQSRKNRLAAEMRAFTARQDRAGRSARKNRGL